jgi:secretion/DNA translocation related TadE-like protein
VSDRGSGSILALAVFAAMLTLCSLLLPLVGVLSARQRLSGAADAAALAAAAVTVGLAPGVPCAEAGRVAAANGATLTGCELDGSVVTVVVKAAILGLPIEASATAGPADDGKD